MTDSKNNIFVQLYGPSSAQQITQPDPMAGQSTSLSPETDPFSTNTPSEYAPILEYVEPQLEQSMQPHMQTANPPFQTIPDIPLTPVTTPLVPGIQPMQIPSIPLSDLEIEAELKTNVFTAIRWLAEWCLRQVQMHHQKELDNTP